MRARHCGAEQIIGRAAADAGGIAVDDEAGAAAGLRIHRQHIGEYAIADPGFLAAHAPAGAVERGQGGNRRRIAARLRLAQQERANKLAIATTNSAAKLAAPSSPSDLGNRRSKFGLSPTGCQGALGAAVREAPHGG